MVKLINFKTVVIVAILYQNYAADTNLNLQEHPPIAQFDNAI